MNTYPLTIRHELWDMKLKKQNIQGLKKAVVLIGGASQRQKKKAIVNGVNKARFYCIVKKSNDLIPV